MNKTTAPITICHTKMLYDAWSEERFLTELVVKTVWTWDWNSEAPVDTYNSCCICLHCIPKQRVQTYPIELLYIPSPPPKKKKKSLNFRILSCSRSHFQECLFHFFFFLCDIAGSCCRNRHWIALPGLRFSPFSPQKVCIQSAELNVCLHIPLLKIKSFRLSQV